MRKGRIIIISGPSGAGKTTLHKRLINDKTFKGKIVESVSVTTRPKRSNEKNGRDYFFITEKMFLYKKRKNHFLESQKVFKYYYATPKKGVLNYLKKRKHVLLCIDVKGAKMVCKNYQNILKIFIKTPSMKILKERLKKRSTETKSELALRINISKKELKEQKKYDHVIINDNLAAAYKNLKNIICDELFNMNE